MQVIELTDEDLKQHISRGITLVDFWAPWCAPCRQQGPIIEELAQEVEGALVAKVNVDENQKTASEFGILSIPTIMIFKNGERVLEMAGLQYKEDLKKQIEKVKA